MTDALVREAIQNTLDARIENDKGQKQKARMRIYISGADGALPPEKVKKWFESLWPHVVAKGNGLREQPDINDPCEYLVIEDFGTTGLTGDPAAHEVDVAVPNNFLNFFRAEGHSDKSGEKGGSWGIGKNAFPRASRINTYFGYTSREDGKALLLGRSIVKFHRVHDKSFKSDGYWGERREDGLMLPVSDPDILFDFCHDFNLVRDSESGLSIIVPWYDAEETQGLSFEGLIEAVARGFFFSILNGILDVEICAPDQRKFLTANSIREAVEGADEKFASKELLPILDLACWREKLDAKNYFELSAPPAARAQNWADVTLDPVKLEEISARISAGERVAVKVPMHVRPLRKEPLETFFCVYLEASQSSHKPVFIRDELVIPDVKTSAVPGIRSLVVISDPPIAELLRRAETPAHTQWSSSTGNFKNQYAFGPSAITFVSTSVSRIMALINKSEQKLDPALTIDYFSIPAKSEQGPLKKAKRPKPVPGGGPAPAQPDLPATSKRFQVQSRKGGFSITPGEAAWKQDFKLRVKAAYDVRRGNPFNRYDPIDFDLKNFKPVMKNVSLIKAQGNIIRFQILDQDFHISLDGFDEMRDLYLDVKAVQ